MRHTILVLALGLAALTGLAGCGNSLSSPRAGDTITPALSVPAQWQAGSTPDISARLQAKGTEGALRQLGFDGIANNPVVRVVFFEDTTELGTAQVTLSHRC